MTLPRAQTLLALMLLTGPALAQKAPRIEVQGHRGAMARLPENTLPAFQHALEVGADTLEFDLAVTSDDCIIVHHDLTIDPELCLSKGGQKLEEGIAIRSRTLAQMKELDCGSLLSPEFPRQKTLPGTPIPTLDEVFELVKRTKTGAARKVRFNIELKGVPAKTELTPPVEVFVRLLLEVTRKHDMEARISVQSFDHRLLHEVRKQAPKVPLAALIGKSLPDLVALNSNLKAEIISPCKDWITAPDVAALHKAGTRVVVWTANTPEDWDRLIDMRVDGIITDNPEALIQHLDATGLR